MAKEIIEQLADKQGITKKKAEEMFKDVFDFIKESLKAGEAVRVHGFGTFNVKERGERVGRNPSTGKPITIPASKTVSFKTSDMLKKSIN